MKVNSGLVTNPTWPRVRAPLLFGDIDLPFCPSRTRWLALRRGEEDHHEPSPATQVRSDGGTRAPQRGIRLLSRQPAANRRIHGAVTADGRSPASDAPADQDSGRRPRPLPA